MGRKEDLQKYLDNVDEDKRQFAYDTLDEYLFFLDRLKDVEKLPLIRIDKDNPAKQKVTPAARLVREYSQTVDIKRRTLLSILYKIESSAADELLEKLKEFE